MSQSSGYQYPLYTDSNNPLKNEPPPIVNGQNPASQQNGMQSPQFNLTGTPSSQSSRDPSRETSRDPSPTQYLHNQYRPQLPRPPMSPINRRRNANVLPPPPRTSQPYSPANLYNAHSQNVASTHENIAVGTSSIAFVSQPSQEIQHRPMIPSNQMPPIAKNLTPVSAPSTFADTIKPEPAKMNQSYQWATNPPPTNIPQGTIGVPGVSSSIDKTSHVSTDQTTESQTSFARVNKISAYNQGHSIPPPASNVNLPPSNVTHLNQNSYVQQEPVSSGIQPPRTQNIQAQSTISPESLSNPQLRYGSQQNISNASSMPNSSTQNLFYNAQAHNVGPRNLHDYSSQPMKSQNLLTGYMDPTGLGSNCQGQNIHQNLAGQRKYPQQDTANTMMLPPSGGNQLQGARLPPSGIPPLPGLQTYDSRSQYPSPMTNVPLDSSNRRYPNMYPDQLNQLNNQMSNLNVTQVGYNKIWGMESIDLLQCRNILPPEKVEPPKIKLNQEFLDSVNCNPDIFRCTLTKVPESNSLLQKSRLPFGVLIHPFKDLNQHLAVIQCNTIVRCRACRTYINPFVYFVDSKRWKCNLCFRLNELPEEFQFDPVTKSYGDPSRRPEVKTGTIEFIAPSEYMVRPPQPAIYLFVMDVSRLAVESGYLQIVCNTITDELSRLPGDSRTQIGFLAVDSTLHFFSMPDNVSQPHEMVMLDIDDVFLPCPENLIVNLKEREELVRDLLAQLPIKFCGTHDTNSALGAGLQAAYKLLAGVGGRITVFQTCLPNIGPGALQPREDPSTRVNKDVPHLNPATDFYKRYALDCSGHHIAIDLFLLNSQYSDLATLSCMSKFTGGCIYHLPLFRASKLQNSETLERLLRRYLTRKIGFEAVMRLRCTRGLSIHAFHGSFFVRSTDLLCLPNINPDAGFGMQISIDENLSDVQSVCFQASLLYTSSKGERRIRVHTLCLPVVASLSDVLHSADQQCIVGLLSKMAVDRSLQSSLSDAREALINVAIDILSAYKLAQSSSGGGLIAPGSLKLLPLYIIALLKSIAFRSGTSTRLDDRIFAMFQLKTLPLAQLIQVVYPDLYPVLMLDDRNARDIDGKVCPQPPRLNLSAEKFDSRGIFLMDAGDRIFIYIGKNINPIFCTNIFGTSGFTSIPEEMYELPELDTVESERLRNFVFSLQEEKPYYVPVQIIRDDSHFRTLFIERLIEDRFESALSYYEFLQHLKTQVKE
ncbi:PREDICTED: protein transport protein Sec24A isoform X1 [Trachymyrmex septentrionalis]|uniref:protein transport protein Sec24A isoform X1 n=2 Tax=Trachymyrmex septentrionalis TaxID=34720 RepID=UPI00084F84DA|nr:PREDICTED: protein transport protein Sec24A isoform X1 [Trachymyrmex septentrionalis]